MVAQPILTKTQKYCLTFTLALVLTLAWTTLAHADGPGDLDTTFGGTGIVTDSISSGPDGGSSVAIQPDGKIVVAGVSDSDGLNDDFAVVRYNSDGNRDTTFNSTGVVTTPIDNASWGFDTVIQPDGKIVVVGNSGRLIAPGVFDYAFAVARYNITGTLDTNFNNTGIVTTSLGNGFETGQSVALQPDGKIVVVGASGTDIRLTVMRYTITGTLDTDFNNTGIVSNSSLSGGSADVALQPNGKIVVLGYDNGNFAMVRYTITGTLDSSFNGTGIVTTPIGISAFGTGIVLQPDGKIVVAGGSDGDFALARYNSDGTLDTSFNGTGIATTTITNNRDFGLDLALQTNGKIVVVGSSGDINDEDGDITVIRYHNDGSLDTTFGGTGVVTTPVGSTQDVAWSVALQPDDKIVVAGFGDAWTNNMTFFVTRYIGDHFAYLPVVLKN